MSTDNTAHELPTRSGWRLVAAVALASLLPATALAWICVLAGPESARCLTYGEQCNPAAEDLHSIAWWSFWVSGVAGVIALLLRNAWPTTAWIRPFLVIGQVALLAVTFVAVVAGG